MSRQPLAHRSGAPLSLLLLGAAVLVVALVAGRTGGSPRTERESTATTAGGAAAASDASGGGSQRTAAAAAGSSAAGGRALPADLEDRGWIAEVAVQRWLAGTLSGRLLVLPADEIGLTATASTVVSVRYGANGRTSTVRVRDMAGGRLRASVDRPGTVSSAVVAGTVVYVTGDAGTGGGADAGVQAISLADGSVRDIIPPGPAPADAAGPVTRTQLRLDPSGTILGSPLCSGDQCTVDLVDLASGARTTPVRNVHGFLVALTSHVLYLVDDTSTALQAVDAATGVERWRVDGVQLGGVLPATDGSSAVVSYLPATRSGPLTFTLASIDAVTGERHVLLERPADNDVPTFYPNLSGDRVAVLGTGGTLGEMLGGAARRAILTLVDARSGATRAGGLTLTTP